MIESTTQHNNLPQKLPKGFKYIELEAGTKKPLSSFDEFVTDIAHVQNAGVLRPRNIVGVDFNSSREIAGKVFNLVPTFAVKTKRGAHLYYKLPKKHNIKSQNNIITAAGVPVDYKTGANNKNALAVIKQDGIVREIFDVTQQINNLPNLMYPVSHSKQNLAGFGAGDGRNNELYKHLLNVFEQIPGIKKENILQFGEFINNFVFSEALEEKELNNIVKSVIEKIESKKSMSISLYDCYGKDGKLDIHLLTDYIVHTLDIKLYNKILYYKRDDHYLAYDGINLFREVSRTVDLKRSKDTELEQKKKKKAKLIDYDNFPVKFKNSYLLDGKDIIQKDLVFTPFLLNVDYDVAAYNEDVDKFLDFLTCDRQDLRKLVEELLGHILMTSSFPHKAFFLVANSGSNGKSTFLTMLSNWAGELSTPLALEELNQPVNLFTLQGKLVNLGDDIDAKYLESSRLFKTLVSGNEIMTKALYQMPTKLRNTATLIFTSNEMPYFKDKSGGIARRIAIIPCDNTVKEIDVHIDKKLSTENAKSYILNLAIAGMKRIIENGGKLSNSETVEKTVTQYLTDNDSFLSYMESIEHKIEGNMFSYVYNKYIDHCDEYGFQPLSKNKIGRRLRDLGFSVEQRKTKGVNNKYIIRTEKVHKTGN